MRKNLYLAFSLLLLFGGWLQYSHTQDTSSVPDKPVVYVFPFKGEVEIGLVHTLERGFREAEEQRATYFLMEMDTPGGRVDSALEIIDLILESKIPVAIYVTGDATSAGAIICLAADDVYMKQATTIGTAAPVFMGGGEADENMEAKALSYVLAQVRKICERKGFSRFKTRLAEAMVDKDIEIEDPDNPGEYITRKGKLLTFTAAEAMKYGFVNDIVEDREDGLEELGIPNAKIVMFEEYLSERVARFLSSTTISSLLVTIAIMALFIEFQSPGLGFPGAVAIIAFLLFFWGHSIAGLAGWEGPVLMVLGIILLMVELFLIPGFGFTGIGGILCIIAAIVVTMLDRSITSPHFFETFNWEELYQALTVTMISLVLGMGSGLAIPALFPFMVQTRAGGWMMLRESEERDQGYQSASEENTELLGKRGVAKTTLRPAGIAVIDGKRADVVSQGAFIPAQAEVEVIKVEGRRIVVRQV